MLLHQKTAISRKGEKGRSMQRTQRNCKKLCALCEKTPRSLREKIIVHGKVKKEEYAEENKQQ
jgi:hypothetical protein